MQIIYKINFDVIFTNMEKKKCNSCKKTGLSKKEKWMVAIGIYIFITSLYGTIQIIKHFF